MSPRSIRSTRVLPALQRSTRDHPARDEKDTFYFPENARFGNVSKKVPEEKYLLRTHTSSVQIRTMLKGEPPAADLPPPELVARESTRRVVR